MRHPVPRAPLWMTVAALLVAVGLVITLLTVLHRDTLQDNTAAERAVQSALLPDGWSTYGADVWSMGYPSTWTVDRVEGGLHFYPADAEEGKYVYVMEETRTPEDVAAAYADVPGVTRSAFLFAGYPAVKYATYATDTYFVAYEDRLFRIATDHPRRDEVGIMLATFQFIE